MSERKAGSGKLHGRPLDDNGSIEWTVDTKLVERLQSDNATLRALLREWLDLRHERYPLHSEIEDLEKRTEAALGKNA